MKTSWIRIGLPLLPLLMGCIGQPDTGGAEPIAEASLAFTIDASMITVTETPADRNTWPKTVTWCVGAGHQTHGSFYWKVSWSASLVSTQTNCITYATSVEICNLWAMIDHDSAGHTGDTLNPKTYSVFDHRDPIKPDISPSPTAQPFVGQSVTLTAPQPHCIRHCDGTGIIVWQVRLPNGEWWDLPGSQNVCTWAVNSPTAGTETYRLKSTHQGYVSYSNEIVVTWSDEPMCTVQVTCPNGSVKSCEGRTCSTTAYSVICDGQGYMCECTVGCSLNSQCDQYCGGAWTGGCSSSCNPNKPSLKSCNCLF
jgi:hypothetical protein